MKADVFKRVFEACSDDPDMEFAMVAPPSSRSIVTVRGKRGPKIRQ